MAQPDLTIDELTAELAAEHGVKVHRSSFSRLLLRLGLSHKKDLQALDQKRQDVANLHRIWIRKRQPFMARHLERLAFIDETSLKTYKAKATGWALADSAWSITHRSRTGASRLSSAPCAMTALMPRGR